jgi:cell division septum initiation protein DivIVA
VDASDRLEQMVGDLVQIVETAKSVPMSASCVINRAEVLEILAQLREDLGEELEESRRLTAERDQVIAQARRDAQEHIEQARRERGSMLSGTEMGREAERIRAEALREAARIREDADTYVDDRLANFEVVLTKTLQAVGRGRAKMGGRDPMDELGQHVAEQDAVSAANRADYEYDERDNHHEPEPYAAVGVYQREVPSQGGEYHTGEYPEYSDDAYAAQAQPDGYQGQPETYQEQDVYASLAPSQQPSHQPHPDYALPEPDLSREFSQADMSGIFQRPDFSQPPTPQPVGHAASYSYEAEQGPYVPAAAPVGYDAATGYDAANTYENQAGYEYTDQQAYPVQPYGAQYAAQPEYHTGEYPAYDDQGYAQLPPAPPPGEHQPGQQGQQGQHQGQPGQADATGFFDTGMIDVRQFRDDPYQR